MRSVFAAFFFAAMVAAPISQAHAQGFTQLVVLQEEYDLGVFKFKPPTFDGWRQVAAGPRGLEFVYAERLDATRINTRVHVKVITVDIPEDASIEGIDQLAELSRKQQVESRGTFVVEPGKVEDVPGSNHMKTYTIVSKQGSELKLHEVFFVAIAGDKSEYAVVQLQTQEDDYEDSLYYAQFYGSIASLKAEADDDKADG